MNAAQSLSEIDPSSLSPRVRSGLDLAERYTLTRQRGYFAAGDARITLATAKDMIGLGLARVEQGRRQPVLMLTGAGLVVLGVWRQRQQRRAGR